MEEISLETAKRLILSKQMLSQPIAEESSWAVVETVKRLGGIQYDPLPIVEQAHYLTLWNRVKNFRKKLLDTALYKQRKLIESVLMRQALHIVPVEELPYYFQAIQRVFRRGWIQRAIDKLSTQDAQEILERIKRHGTVSSKDVPYGRLRALFYTGKIAIMKRDSGIFRMPHYCLLNSLHPNLDLKAINEEAAQKWLVKKTISAYGIASTRHISFWTGYKVKETQEILNQLERENIVRRVKVLGLKGYHWITPKDFDRLKETTKEENVALLSPMDNLTRDRKWLNEVFGDSFSIEYFQKKGMRWQISILYGTSFLGFIDAKMDRPNRTFILKELKVHSKARKDAWIKVIKRIVDIAKFHRAATITVGVKFPKWFSNLFRTAGYKYKASLVMI